MVENETNNEASVQFNAAVKLKEAISFKNAGKYESALISIDEALKLQENYVDAWLMKGVILGQWGRCAESLKCYDKIIEIDPCCANAWHLKAATFIMQNRYEQAVECEIKAIELEPDNMDLYLRLAAFYQKLKKFEDAQKCYDDLLKQKPNNPQIHYLIGISHGNKGDYQKALDSIDQALGLKADFTEALIVKGVLLSKLGRADEAKLCAEKVLEVKNESEKQSLFNQIYLTISKKIFQLPKTQRSKNESDGRRNNKQNRALAATNILKSIYEGYVLKILEGTINVRTNKKLPCFRHTKRHCFKQALRSAETVG